jgi:hypothetical protein
MADIYHPNIKGLCEEIRGGAAMLQGILVLTLAIVSGAVHADDRLTQRPDPQLTSRASVDR